MPCACLCYATYPAAVQRNVYEFLSVGKWLVSQSHGPVSDTQLVLSRFLAKKRMTVLTRKPVLGLRQLLRWQVTSLPFVCTVPLGGDVGGGVLIHQMFSLGKEGFPKAADPQ